MKLIALKGLDTAFGSGLVRGVTVVRKTEREWFLTVRIEDKRTGRPDVYALRTTRGEIRSWADPRKLFAFLCDRFGVLSGSFDLEEVQDEVQGTPAPHRA